MAAPRRTRIQREKDLLLISEMYLRGKTQAEIGDVIGMSQQQISYDLKILRNRWLAQSVANIDEIKARELAKVDHLERTYWESWKRSLEDFTVKTTKARKTRQVDSGEKIVKVEGRNGDPRYLQGVQWCVNKRCEILGLNAPSGLELTSAGKPIVITSIGAVVPETSECGE